MKPTIKVAREPKGGYQAWCPLLPGCAVWGKSQDEVLGKIDSAVRGYLASLNVAYPRESERPVAAG